MDAFDQTIEKQWSQVEPLNPLLLESVKTIARENAMAHFGDYISLCSSERCRDTITSHLNKQLVKREVALNTRNEKLALLSAAVDKSIQIFTNNTHPDGLWLPWLEEELMLFLMYEKRLAINLFEEKMARLKWTAAYSSQHNKLKMQLHHLMEERKKQNVQAYKLLKKHIEQMYIKYIVEPGEKVLSLPNDLVNWLKAFLTF